MFIATYYVIVQILFQFNNFPLQVAIVIVFIYINQLGTGEHIHRRQNLFEGTVFTHAQHHACIIFSAIQMTYSISVII